MLDLGRDWVSSQSRPKSFPADALFEYHSAAQRIEVLELRSFRVSIRGLVIAFVLSLFNSPARVILAQLRKLLGR